MSVLVAYASKHGATQEIAERIAERLTADGQPAEARPTDDLDNPSVYDAFVVGSATYNRHWRKQAANFVRDNLALLAARPVWLFSSGPLGAKSTDQQGHDLHTVAEPNEIAEFRIAFTPRDHRVFFGALDHGRLTFTERMVARLPATRAMLPEGDFRDWQEIDNWADGIAQALSAQPASR